jgi:hypothetical protein
MNKLVRNALITLMTMTITLTSPAAEPQRSPQFFPLGVYWAGEFVPRGADGKHDYAKIGPLLDSLKAHHCNTIWLTHTGAAEAAEFARHAAKRGIYLVASLGELAGNEHGVRQPAHYRGLPERILKTWGDAPKPIAWGLGDEPRTEYMHQMKGFTEEWARSGEPVTTVVMAGELAAAGMLMKQTFLCTDIYPFFTAGNPNGPDTISESAAYVHQAGRRALAWAQRNGIEYWFMGQIFQEPWGNREVDEQGNIVYLPGAAAHFRMPTVAEVHWQNWAALATGARGLIHFIFTFGEQKSLTDPNAKPLPHGVKEKTNSGSPGGMVYHDGRPTPQYTAMGESFGVIAKLTPLLKQIAPVESLAEEQLAFHAKGWIPPGDIVQVMKSRTPQKYYVIVANGEVDNPEPRAIPVNFPPQVVKVTDLRTGEAVALTDKQELAWEPVCAPFQQARILLPPGHGTLLELTMK